MTTTKTIYLIRHGEKPPKNYDGSDRPGLSAKGRQRAQHIRTVFGHDSPYGIRHIFVQKPATDGKRIRALETMIPLAKDLGIAINAEIERDDAEELAVELGKLVDHHSEGNILVCWEHHTLTTVVRNIITHVGKRKGAESMDGPFYPSDRYDVIWTMHPPFKKHPAVSSQNTPLDTQ